MTLDQFVAQNEGKKLDYDGVYGGQCVDLFRFYVRDVLGFPQPKGVNGAADFWTNYPTDYNLHDKFTRIANSPTAVPLKGDVMLWNKKAGGGFGHVAVFLSGDVNSFVSFDQNWRALNVCEKTNHTYTNVYGWLRPKGADMYTEAQMTEVRLARDENWNLYQNSLKKIKALEEASDKAATYAGNLENNLDKTTLELVSVKATLSATQDTLAFSQKEALVLKEEIKNHVCKSPEAPHQPPKDEVIYFSNPISRLLMEIVNILEKKGN